MELIFVGTSSGKTSLTRFHSSLLFKTNSSNILIDAGDGISKALLNQHITFNSISDIVLSHYHSDHLAGLTSLLTQMIINNRTEALKIYTHSELIKPLNSFLQTNFLFLKTLNFEVKIIGFNFNHQIILGESFKFTAKQNSHITNKHGLNIVDLAFLSSSFLFQIKDHNIIYTSDIGSSNDLYLFNEYVSDIFITETTHVTLEQIEDAVTILKPKITYLTHIDDELKLKGWFEKLPADKSKIIIIAEDGIKLKL